MNFLSVNIYLKSSKLNRTLESVSERVFYKLNRSVLLNFKLYFPVKILFQKIIIINPYSKSEK